MAARPTEGAGVPSARRPAEADRSPALGGLQVLLVEDNVDNEELFCYMLRPTGVELTVARDGASAIGEVVRRQAAGPALDVILMDMQMPVMDGLTATTVLRRMGVKIPIIAVSAYAMEHQRQQCLDAGCDACLPKPIVRSDLFVAIARVTGRESAGAAVPPPVAPAATLTPSPGFAEIRQRYLGALRDYRQVLVQAESVADVASIRKVVHRLKGTAASYGYSAITEVAKVCQEELCQGAGLERIDGPLQQLRRLLDEALAVQ